MDIIMNSVKGISSLGLGCGFFLEGAWKIVFASQTITKRGMKISLIRSPFSAPRGIRYNSPTTGSKIMKYSPNW